MNSPWWREQTQFWYVKINGKQVRLSEEKDPDGGTRKGPPPNVENAWHRLTQAGEPKEMRLADVFTVFREARDDHGGSTGYMFDQFLTHVGKEMKASKLKPYHLTDFLKTKKTWSQSTIRTFVNRILAAINLAVTEGHLEKNPVSSTPGYRRQGRHTRRKGVVTPDLARKLEEAANLSLRAILIGLRETGCRPGELRKARVERCFVDRGVMYVHNKIEHATGEAERPVYLSEAMKELLRKA